MDRVDYQSLVVQDLVNLDKSEELELSPWYQRRSVWSDAQKSYLLNTLFEKKPIPAIYIRHSLNLEKSKSIKEIVDGQQRTRTIIGYCNNEFAAKHPAHEKKVKFSQLKRSEQNEFLLTGIPIGYLLGATDADVIDIFGRINSVSKVLNAQEKRNAQFSGEMKQFCLKQGSSRIGFWRSYRIFSATNIARMFETQFMSDIVFNLINGLSDFTSKNLDRLYKDYDDEFPEAWEIAQRIDWVFDLIATVDPDQFATTIFKRQPVFFSLFIALDGVDSVTPSRLSKIIWDIDSRFQEEKNATDKDVEFRNACTSTTQRIRQRNIRHEYICSFF